MKNTVTVTSNRSRAAVQLSSWLEAVGIETVPQENGTFRLKEGIHYIQLLDKGQEVTLGNVGIYWEDMWSRDLSIALEAFQGLLKDMGYKVADPLPNRGSDAKEDLTETDFWINHCELRRAPNPPQAFFDTYMPIVKQRVFKFVMSNWALCQQLGMEKDDIQQYVLCYLTSFYGLFRIIRPGDVERDNERMLNNLIKQRLALLRKRMTRKCLLTGFEPTEDEKLIQFGEVVEERPEAGPLTDLEEHDTYRERKLHAAAMLRTTIKKMPLAHAKAALEKIVTSPRQPEEVRKEAAKHLARLVKTKQKRARSDSVER